VSSSGEEYGSEDEFREAFKYSPSRTGSLKIVQEILAKANAARAADADRTPSRIIFSVVVGVVRLDG
jgi:hypothetical protein